MPLITLEGPEGSGKSTQSHLLYEHICNRLQIKNCVLTREPGATEVGRKIRSLLLDPNSNIHPRAELLLNLADRVQHLQEVILPALANDAIVICDRYLHSTLAYQGYGRHQGYDFIKQLQQILFLSFYPEYIPSLTIFLDFPIADGLERARSRNHQVNLHQESKFDVETYEFHTLVREGYLKSLSDPEHSKSQVILPITPEQTQEEVFELILKHITPFLP